MADFEILAEESNARDIKIIMDFVPNHSSNEHDWFVRSEQKEDPYTDYYIWRDRNESNPGQVTKDYLLIKIIIYRVSPKKIGFSNVA